MDNIVNKATEHGPYTYNYDSLYRLVRADSRPLTAESYSYDPVGNRLTSSTANNWTYNPNNDLQSYNGVTFQYDLNGNTIQKNENGTVQKFLYNEDDRLTEVKDGNGAVIATYYYDPFGRRLWKEVSSARTYFMYADEGLIAEFDGAGAQPKAYGYAPNSNWTTNPLFMKQSGQYYFYHNDHLGTPQKMTAVNGSTVWSATYESFGKAIIDQSSTIVNNLRFPGQYCDSETGLHYNYQRYYDSNSGRYFLTDVIGITGGFNLFTYVNGNPLRSADPEGLRPLTIVDFEPLGWPFEANAFRNAVRSQALWKYREGLKLCEEYYNFATDYCSRREKSEECLDLSVCSQQATSFYNICMRRQQNWRELHENYSWSRAFFSCKRYSEEEIIHEFMKEFKTSREDIIKLFFEQMTFGIE